MTSYDYMVWTDWETNGLHKDGPVCPFEVGIIVTDKEGIELSTYNSIILPERWYEYKVSDYVKEMHTKSGLWDEIEIASNMDSWNEFAPETIQRDALDWLGVHDYLQPGEHFLCGSTINFDRRVMLDWMPELHNWFHYRNTDISTVKNLCRMLNKPVAAKLEPSGDKKTHRVLDDIRGSIFEYRFYKDNFLHVYDEE